MCHKIAITTIVLGCLLNVTMSFSADNKKPSAAENNTGLARDIRLLRKTFALPKTKPPVQASSADARKAAARIFGRLKFIGMSKEDVLWVLGDPATISDYGFKAGAEVDAPLVYRFADGRGGNDYRLEFKDGRVTHLRTIGVD